MPLFLIVAGSLLAITAARGTTPKLMELLRADVPGFGYWGLAVVIIASFGYVKKLEPLSDAFLFLVFLQMAISNRGAFENFRKAFEP